MLRQLSIDQQRVDQIEYQEISSSQVSISQHQEEVMIIAIDANTMFCSELRVFVAIKQLSAEVSETHSVKKNIYS